MGRKPILVAGALMYTVLAYPLFLLLHQGTTAHVLTAQLVFALAGALACGAAPAAFVEMFPTRTRYSGIAIGYNGTQALVGGTTPWVATWLIEVTGYNLAPAFYLLTAAVITLMVALRLQDRYDQPLR